MANIKITALPANTSVTPGSDVLPLVSAGVTTKATPSQIVNATLLAPGPIGSTTPGSGSFTTLNAANAISGAGFSNYLSSPPPIGSSSANSGRFTTLTVNGSTTLNVGLNGLLQATSGVVSVAAAGVNYAPPTSGTSILYGNGSGGFSNVAIGSGLTFSSGTLSATGGGGGSGTVTSVGLSLPSIFTVTNSPVTTTGTLTATLGSQTANSVFAGPTTGSAVPTFRALVASDIPALSYAPATTGSSILYANGSGGFSSVTVGSGLSFSAGTLAATSSGGSVTSVSVVSANGLAGTVATSTTTPAITLSTTITGLLKGNGTAISAATAGTDYAPATSGSSILYGNGSGGFSNVTIGSNLTFASGTLSATGGGGMTYPGAGIPNSTGSAWGTSYGTSGATSVVLRDANVNISTNNIFVGYTVLASSGTTTTLTAASVFDWSVTGSSGQTFQLPNATTLPVGAAYTFNNNQSSGVITLNNNSGSSLISGGVGSGGYVELILQDNSSAAGTWDYHFQIPANVSWTTNTLNYPGSFTGGTWNGSTVAVNRGGTGATTLTGIVKGNGTSAFTAATSGTDYSAGTSALTTGIVKSTTSTGALSIAVSGTDYAPATSGSAILKGNGSGGFSSATAGTDYSAGTSALTTGLVKSTTTTGALSIAVAGTDYVSPGGALGTPSSGTLTSCTGLPIGTGVSGLGTNVATFLATPSSANLASALTDETGSGSAVFANTPTLVTPILGTPQSGTLTSCTGLPISSGVSGLGTNVATFLATPSSANLASALTDETGSGLAVFNTNPTFTNYTETAYTANSSTAITLSLANGTMQYITLTGSPTITMPTAASGKSFTLILYTGSGSYTVSWSTVSWAGGTTPTVTTTASKKDIFNFYSDGTNWYGSTFGQSF